MKSLLWSIMLFLLLAAQGFCGTEAVVIGIAGEGAPAIEQCFTRHVEECLAALPGVRLVDNDEVRRLRSRLDPATYPTITAPLAAAIGRCVHDSALVIWGMVRKCTMTPVRKHVVQAAIRADLTMALTIYDYTAQATVYSGEVKAAATIDKGWNFWFGPIDEAVQASATERGILLDSLQMKAAGASSAIVQGIVKHKAAGAAASRGASEANAGTPPPDSANAAAASRDSSPR